MGEFSSNQFSWQRPTLFVVCRDWHSVREPGGFNPGYGYALGRLSNDLSHFFPVLEHIDRAGRILRRQSVRRV